MLALPDARLASFAEVLAENNFGDTRSGSLAGPTGLLIILLLVVGTILLIRNMNSRLRRLPDRFPQPTEPPRGDDSAPGEDADEPESRSAG
jgi:hypothetical protein